METTPPHDILGQRGRSTICLRVKGSKTIIRLMSDSQIFLKDHLVNRERIARGLAPANSIWLWGQGRKPSFPPFYERYGTRGAVVAAVDLIKGIGALAGFDTPRVEGATGYLDTDYGAKARRPWSSSTITTSSTSTWRRPTRRPTRGASRRR